MTAPDQPADDEIDDDVPDLEAPDLEDPDLDESDIDEPGARSGGIGSIRGDHNVSVTDPRGSVIIMKQAEVYLRSAARDDEPGTSRSARLVPEDILTNLAKSFVSPPGYGGLVTQLRNPGTVVISGAPGTGRRSAALMVLKESGKGATRFRELPDDDAEAPVFDADFIETGERLLLDLSTEPNPIAQQVITDLRAYRAAVAERQAFLAVVLPFTQQHVAAELGTTAVIIERPDGHAVFRKHLAEHGITVTDQELTDETLLRHLTSDPIRQVAALAERIHRARVAAPPRDGWTAWLATALKTDTYADTVAQFMKDNPDGRARALLLAAAMFEHATPEVVEFTAAKFLEVTRYPPPEGHRLDLPDLAEALAQVKASIEGQQVRFESVAYGAAVRTHFWRTFPDLRHELRQWVDRSARSKAVPSTDRSSAVLRYTDQCLRIGHPRDLCTLVERWAKPSAATPDRMVDIAAAALTRALRDEQYGRWFRQRVYHWTRNRQLSPSLATLLVGLCEEVIAPVFPHQALVRLRYLTRHHHLDVVTEARAALTRLSRDGRFARRLLARVHEDLVGEHPHDVDYALFTDIADPVRLTQVDNGGFPRITERLVRSMLTDGWANWLTARPYEDTVAAVARWLDAHAAAPRRNELLEILATATRGRSRLCAVLYGVSRDWVAMATPDQQPAYRRTAVLLREACADARTAAQPPTEPRPIQGAGY